MGGGLAWLLMLMCFSSQAASPQPVSTPPPTYTGSATCSGCHREAGAAWQGSHHAQAMQRATPASVLGDFKGARFEHHGQVTEFLRRGDRYLVRTEGADGQRAVFEATHVLGVYPLQQLLIALPRGRLQAFGIAWDARPRSEGGQRWYPLYPDDPPPPGDALHWSGRAQSANAMCLSCHTTGYRKQYDTTADAYRSTQAELGVGCEACHGPGSAHRDWARRGADQRADAARGLVVPQARLNRRVFAFLPGRPIAQAQDRPRDAGANQGVDGPSASEVCQGCHARRSELLPAAPPQAPFLDAYSPAWIEPGLYQADGRIDGEVFEYGSFAQSAMHAAGVGCTNCHDAHALKPHAAGNALCGQCHLPSHYDTSAHGRPPPAAGTGAGPAGEAGAGPCVGCHMPTRTYMGVHVRHDHSLRLPGAPARSDSAFVRASVLARGSSPSELQVATRDADPLVRLGAARGLATLPLPQAVAIGAPLLDDARRAVRIEAARALVGTPPALWTAASSAALQRATDELIAAEQQAADRPEAQLNLGTLYQRLGRMPQAEQALRRALWLDRGFVPAYVNLADLVRRQGCDDEAGPLLHRATALAPREAAPAHALGLWFIRRGRLADALPWLRQAWQAAPRTAPYGQTLGLALAEAGRPGEGLDVLLQTRRDLPGDTGLLRSLIQTEQRLGRLEDARGHEALLQALLRAANGADPTGLRATDR